MNRQKCNGLKSSLGTQTQTEWMNDLWPLLLYGKNFLWSKENFSFVCRLHFVPRKTNIEWRNDEDEPNLETILETMLPFYSPGTLQWMDASVSYVYQLTYFCLEPEKSDRTPQWNCASGHLFFPTAPDVLKCQHQNLKPNHNSFCSKHFWWLFSTALDIAQPTRGTSDFKQNTAHTHENKPYSGLFFHALVIRFDTCVSSRHHPLTGWNSLSANQKLLYLSFLANTRYKSDHTLKRGMKNWSRKWFLFICTIFWGHLSLQRDVMSFWPEISSNAAIVRSRP